MDVIVHETQYCKIAVPNPPHVTRADGGHMIIYLKRRVQERQSMTRMEAIEVMLASMALGWAMLDVLKGKGIDVQTINYQDNGKIAFLKDDDATTFHVHVYGRAKDAIFQPMGKALFFPVNQNNMEFYERNEPLNEDDVREIIELFKKYFEQYTGAI